MDTNLTVEFEVCIACFCVYAYVAKLGIFITLILMAFGNSNYLLEFKILHSKEFNSISP